MVENRKDATKKIAIVPDSGDFGPLPATENHKNRKISAD
jgi:hypothetical protein